MPRCLRLASCGAIVQLVTSTVGAQSSPPLVADASEPPGTRARVQARSDTYLRLFERALMPGPSGSIVAARAEAPIHEYVSVRAQGIEPPWGGGSASAEVAAWGGVTWGEPPPRRLDADVTTAFIEQRWETTYLRLGRQSVTSAAARYARLDGLAGGIRSASGVGVNAYAGWTVLPRWDARPGYQHLGAAADSLLRDPEATGGLDRSGHFMSGGRVYFDLPRAVVAGLSFHDQREGGELARRNLGLDLRVSLDPDWSAAADAVLDTDAWELADTRLWVDFFPSPAWSLTGEYLHTEPALFLSHQSVLSVFGTEGFDEVGGSIEHRPLRHVSLSVAAHAQIVAGDVGMRSEARARAVLDAAERCRVLLGHTRLLGADNGYHALRAALGYAFTPGLHGRIELYAYLYDEPIASRSTSLVQAASLELWAQRPLRLLWGASLVQSPYAAIDLQTLLRLTYAPEAG